MSKVATDMYSISPHLIFASYSEIESVIAYEIGPTFISGGSRNLLRDLLAVLFQQTEGVSAEQAAQALTLPTDEATAILQRLVEDQVLLRSEAPIAPLSGMGAVIARTETPGIAVALARTRVRVLSSTEMFYLEQLHARLAQLGVRVSSEPKTDLTIVVGTSPDDPLFQQVNEEGCAQAPLSWAAIIPFNGTDAWLGPLHHPGRTGCYRCFYQQCLNTLTPSPMIARPDDDPDVLETFVTRVQIGILANRINRWIVRRFTTPQFLLETAVRVQITNGRVTLRSYRSRRDPDCPLCGSHAVQPHSPRASLPGGHTW